MRTFLSGPPLPPAPSRSARLAKDNVQELTAEAAAARQAAATAEAETARIRGKSEDIQRKARSALSSKAL